MGLLDDLLAADPGAVAHAECKSMQRSGEACGWAGDATGPEATGELAADANEHMETFGHDVTVDVGWPEDSGTEFSDHACAKAGNG